MITIRRVAPERYAVTINCREPRIYLDHWAIRRIAEDPARRARFLAALSRGIAVVFDDQHAPRQATETATQCASVHLSMFFEDLGVTYHTAKPTSR
jgi:hypothetical protein